jgi:hypothetical protein
LVLSGVQDVEQAVEKIPDGNPQRQDRKPVLLEKRDPLVAVGQTLVFYELPEEDVAPDRAQPEGDRIQDEPEDDVFSGYGNLSFSEYSRRAEADGPLTKNLFKAASPAAAIRISQYFAFGHCKTENIGECLTLNAHVILNDCKE